MRSAKRFGAQRVHHRHNSSSTQVCRRAVFTSFSLKFLANQAVEIGIVCALVSRSSSNSRDCHLVGHEVPVKGERLWTEVDDHDKVEEGVASVLALE